MFRLCCVMLCYIIDTNCWKSFAENRLLIWKLLDVVCTISTGFHRAVRNVFHSVCSPTHKVAADAHPQVCTTFHCEASNKTTATLQPKTEASLGLPPPPYPTPKTCLV